ncbi:ATP-binding protein [Burkholderia gladioli]|uniref:ATP-binding protein n=1 Tax=Burkholderia gladioli TaxID=28095 RepID=UPI0016415482|nr:ATP-binding protein [Burkholderia gladioli]
MSAIPEKFPSTAGAPVSTAIISLSATSKAQEGTVALTNELVGLLSSQLYRTPIKAIEELVVNSFDADASECYVAVPSPDGFASGSSPRVVAVLDDGLGMDANGLLALWEIGKSRKRDEDVAKRYTRAQIGKFGIGKLATYAIANCVTYISKSDSGICAVTLDYREFKNKIDDPHHRVRIQAVEISDWKEFSKKIDYITHSLGVEIKFFEKPHWTLCLLEELKDKVLDIKTGRLKWVLSTAMPLDPTGKFQLHLGGEEIESSKANFDILFEFPVTEIPANRFTNLNAIGDENWRIENGSVVSKSFPIGITGKIQVYGRPLTGKSDDLGRSNGFFIRVRNRLLNEDEPLFGLDPLSFTTFNRFRADLQVDDLDPFVLSSREEIENADAKRELGRFLSTCFNEARNRFDEHERAIHHAQRTKPEELRQYVDARLVERPVADVLTRSINKDEGSEADQSWFYLNKVDDSAVDGLIDRLYNKPRTGYSYLAENLGKTNRIVKFDVEKSEFILNLDHEFIQAHYEDIGSRRVLYDFATAEALLEVHLREEGVPANISGEILERRDRLLRGLANDHAFSPKLIAQALRDASANQYDLEVALIRAARVLGFNAKHIAGAGEPDGIARLADYPGGEQKITLEAKSSAEVPQLSQLDISGIHEHYTKWECRGALVVAPSYPGSTLGDESALSFRANQAGVSCWTVDQLARVVESVESRHITAADVLEIVTSSFTPESVSSALDKLLGAPYAKVTLYRGILNAFRKLATLLVDQPRSVDMITTVIAIEPTYSGVTRDEVKLALKQMAGASKGGLVISNEQLILRISLDELENRIATLLNGDPISNLGGPPGRGRGGFTLKDQTWD